MIADECLTQAASLLTRWGQSAKSCAGDLQALSTASVSWEDMDREQIATFAARALANALELEFAAVQLEDSVCGEVFRHSSPHGKSSEVSGISLQDLRREACPWPTGGVFDWQSPSGGPVMRIVCVPIGLRDDGWVFAGSITESFLKDSKYVILTAFANEIAIAIRNWRTKHAQRDEREHLRQFSEHSPDALWVIKINSMQIEYISPAFARIWGKNSKKMLGDVSRWSSTIYENDRASVLSALRAAANGETITQKYSIILSALLRRQIRHVLFPIRDDQGRVTHVGGAAKDITTTADNHVYVLSSDVAFRERVALLLRANGFPVKLFTSSRVFLEAAPVLLPGCLILERRGTGTRGLDLVSELKARGIDLPIIIADNSRGGVRVAVNAMKAGATDWLEAPYEETELVAAVASALAGVQVLRDADNATKLARSHLAEMTPREREVLLGLVAGETNKEIARRIGISPRTVENHRARVMERLGAKTLSEAVMMATSTGLL